VWESVLAITWTRAVISCRVNCCQRPVLTSLLAAVVLRPPQRPHRRWRGLQILFFYNIDIGDLPTPMFQQAPMSPIFDDRCVQRPIPSVNLMILIRLEFSTRSREFLFSSRENKFWRINILTDQHPTFTRFFHLLRSIASSLFNLCA